MSDRVTPDKSIDTDPNLQEAASPQKITWATMTLPNRCDNRLKAKPTTQKSPVYSVGLLRPTLAHFVQQRHGADPLQWLLQPQRNRTSLQFALRNRQPEGNDGSVAMQDLTPRLPRLDASVGPRVIRIEVDRLRTVEVSAGLRC